MSEDEEIYVDAAQPATLHDGAVHTDCPTLQEAVIAWHRLPPVRQQTATISSKGNVYTAHQINRLHYAPKPETNPEVNRARLGALSYDSSDVVTSSHVAARRNAALNMSGSVEPLSPIGSVSTPPTPAAGTAPSEIQSIPPANSAAAIEMPATGPLESSRGIPLVMRESLAAGSIGVSGAQAELTLRAAPDSIERTLSDRHFDVANAARALAEQFSAQVEELRQNKPNDPDRLTQYDSLIPFLEKMAYGLANLADALDKLAGSDAAPEPVLLGKAAEIARWLQKAATDWLEANNTMVIDVPIRLGLFGFGIAFVHALGIDSTAVTAGLAYLAGLRSPPPRS
jgi:hypothetical protein